MAVLEYSKSSKIFKYRFIYLQIYNLRIDKN